MQAPAAETRQIHSAPRHAYAAPRTTAARRRKGRSINPKKAEQLMREHGTRGITRRRRRNPIKTDTTAAPSPDLAGRDFTAAGLGTKPVGDITYPPTLADWWHLTTVIDLAAREVTVYAMADHHRAQFLVDTLKKPAARGGLKKGCVTHSDRGSEYTSSEYRTPIRELDLRQSMGRTGSCCDNPAAESVSGRLKAETGTTVWESHKAARADIFRFIEVEYNRTCLRKHRSTAVPAHSKPEPWRPETSSPPQRNHPLPIFKGGTSHCGTVHRRLAGTDQPNQGELRDSLQR